MVYKIFAIKYKGFQFDYSKRKLCYKLLLNEFCRRESKYHSKAFFIIKVMLYINLDFRVKKIL